MSFPVKSFKSRKTAIKGNEKQSFDYPMHMIFMKKNFALRTKKCIRLKIKKIQSAPQSH